MATIVDDSGCFREHNPLDGRRPDDEGHTWESLREETADPAMREWRVSFTVRLPEGEDPEAWVVNRLAGGSPRTLDDFEIERGDG